MKNPEYKETILTPLRHLFTIALFFLVCIGYTRDPQTLIKEANKAYSDGLYTDAREKYLQVADAGWESPRLYYNLGNAYFKLNDYPRAILWYERAKRLDPGDEDIIYNLNVANSKIADKIESIPVLFYVRLYQGITNLFSVTGWAIQTVICFMLALAAILLYMFSTRILFRKTGFWAGAVFMVMAMCTLLFSVSGSYILEHRREAIVFDPTTTVKSSPDKKSIDIFVLHEGTKVRLIDRIGDWYEIRIANGSVGWLPAEAVEEI